MNKDYRSVRLAAARAAACVGLAMLLLCGCDGGKSPQELKKEQQAAAEKAAAEKAVAEKAAAEKATKQSTQPTKSPAEAAKTPATTQKKAEVGVGKKGHYGKGVVATP